MHGGNTLSFTSASYVLPEQRLSISILSNGYGDSFGSVALELMERSDTLPVPFGSPVYPTEETDLVELVGTYIDPTVGEIVVTDEDGQLHVEVPFFEELGYSVDGDLEFTITDVYSFEVEGSPVELIFYPDDEGEYRWAGNRTFVGTRTDVGFSSLPAASRRSPVDVQLGLAQETRWTRELTALRHATESLPR